MGCLEAFIGKPVMVQLKNQVLAAISSEEVELEEESGVKCGCAMAAILQPAPDDPQGKPQPILVSVIRGSIEDVDEKYIILATMGGDSRTPVRLCMELENVANVTFCVEHVPVNGPPRIVLPGGQ